jgi:nucleoside phosphorylase
MKIEKIQELLAKLEQIQSILIDVATGCDIRDEEDYYKHLYQEIELLIDILNEEGLAISNPNIFKSLWDWRDYYSSNELDSNARQKYIYENYTEINNNIEDFLLATDDSTSNCINNLEISFFEETTRKIERIQTIMIDVATGKSQVKNKEEDYINLYQDIKSRIKRLEDIGIPITNPNFFRSLSYWKSYYLCEFETYKSRHDYVNNLYINVVTPIQKSLQRSRLEDNSLEEFIKVLKRYLIKAQSSHISKQISQPQSDVISITSNPEGEVIANLNDVQQLEPISKVEATSSSRELISFTVPTAAAQPIQNLPFNNVTDVVIITALEKERDAVLRYLDSPQLVENLDKTFHTALIKTHIDTTYQIIVICLHCMGNVTSALATQKIITNFNPSYIILAGIAGGVPKDNRDLGDVIVGEQIVYYELGKQIEFKTQRRYEPHRPPKLLLDKAKNLSPENWAFSLKAQRPDNITGKTIPKVHFGVVASGDKVIADSSLRDELQSHWPQLVGVDMEAAGAALAAYDSNFMPGILIVKGICDWADGSKNDIWQEYAAESSASFVVELLKSEPFVSKLKSNISNSPEPAPISNLIPDYSNNKDYKVVKANNKIYPPSVKRSICRKLIRDWQDLADELGIEPYESATFSQGREPHAIWEWLKERDKLHKLEEALIAIGREDLVEELNK